VNAFTLQGENDAALFVLFAFFVVKTIEEFGMKASIVGTKKRRITPSLF